MEAPSRTFAAWQGVMTRRAVGLAGTASALYNFNQTVQPHGRFGNRYAVDHAESDTA
jgi:hypothetical protein